MQREVSKWLKFLGFRISSKYLYQQLATHPAFPSLLSLTDTLDHLGISNGVIEVNKDSLPELPFPLLAHLKKDSEEEIVLIKNKTMLLRQPVFYAWDGVVVLAEYRDFFNNPEENLRYLREEKNEKMVRQISLGLLCMLVISTASLRFSPSHFYLLLSTIAGLILSFSIALKSVGLSNQVTKALCDTSGDCSHVIHARPFRLPLGVSISDICFAYFGGLMIYQCLWIPNSYMQGGLNSLLMFSILTLPVTMLSIVYQAFFLRKFCRLCNGIIIILWIQFALLLEVSTLHETPKIELVVTAILIALVLFSWISAKQNYLSKKQLQGDVVALSRFKRDPSIFKWRLSQAKSVDTTSFAAEIYVGNPDAKLDFLVVCNPYCGACSYAHDLLTEILNVHRDNVCLRVRFAVNTAKESDNLTATKYLMQLLAECSKAEEATRPRRHHDPGRNEKLLHDWFKGPDLDTFSKKYPLRLPIDVSCHLAEHERWTRNTGIQYTPTFYINNHEYPAGYYLEELKYMVSDLISQAGSVSTE